MKTKNKILAIILAILMVISIIPITVSAAVSGTCGENATWSYDSKTCTLTISGTGEMNDYFWGKRPWEKFKDKMKTVVIFDGITVVTSDAFYDCNELTSVTLPDSLKSIEERAFIASEKLTNINIPESVTFIGDSAFRHCPLSGEITIHDGVTSVGEYAFSNCDGITSVIISSSATYLDGYVFSYCDNLESVTFPDDLTRIPYHAFSRCTSLKNISIPDSIKRIGDSAFFESGYYNDESNWENGLLYLDKYLLEVDSDIVSGVCEIRDGTEFIADSTFSYNRTITNIVIPDSVKTIGNRAFIDCSELKEVYIPKGVEYIGECAFALCDVLEKITVDENNEYYSSDEYGVLFNKDKTTLMQYPCGNARTEYIIPDGVTKVCYEAFYTCENLKDITIPVSVTTIENNCIDDLSIILHYGGTEEQWKQLLADNSEAAERLAYFNVHCSDKTYYPSGSCGDETTWKFDGETGTLTISGSGHMDDYEYSNHSGYYGQPWATFNYQHIKNIVIDDGVLSVGEGAFWYSNNLKSVTIGNTVRHIGGDAFGGCESLTDVYYHGTESEWNKIEIDNYNSYLLNADIHFEMSEDVLVSGVCGENLTWTFNTDTGKLVISGDGEMYDNPTWDGYKDKITNVIIEDCKKTWGDFVISSGVTSIGESAFSGCEELKRISIPDSLTTIGVSAFEDCKNLTRINIPDSVTVIGENAFKNCTRLEKAFIGSGITIIEDGVFYNCVGLKEVTMTVNVTAIDSGVFYGCDELEDVYYTGSEENWNEIELLNESLEKATIHFSCLECKHDYQSGTVAPTCTKQGYTWHRCSICEDYYKDDYIDPTGHTFDYDCGVVIAPGCNSSGYTKYTCIFCDYFYRDDYVDALGHKYEAVVTEPTCEEPGFTVFTCTVCDYSYTGDNKEATGHNSDNWEVITQPTCAKTGTQKGICSNCGEEVTQSIPSLGHDYGELIVEYEATCTKDGRKSKECSRCGNKTAIEKIPAYGHTYSEWEQVDDATCGKYGRFERVCSTCGNLNVMNAISEKHDYSIESNVVEATCTTDGSKTIECSGCGAKETQTIPATGHSYTSEITTPATHTETGLMTYTCDCGDSYTEVIEKISKHTYEPVVTAPTCTEQGYTTYICVCGDTYVADYVDALGHTEEIIPAIAPSCTETGLTEGVKCSVCVETLTEQKELPANGHSPATSVEENYVVPTCTSNGSKDVVVYCSVCDKEISRETETIVATDHADNDGDGYCDADNELLDPTVECDCNCHKDGISNFFFRFKLFFQKIFGANKTCDCGVAHY